MEECVVIEWSQAVQQSEAGQARLDDKENIASGLSLRVPASEPNDYSRSNNGLLVNLDLIFLVLYIKRKDEVASGMDIHRFELRSLATMYTMKQLHQKP
ncbi:uncharacterized protein BT62DRAFT_553269 [Guyanagaster necrorhizus]|uniref:Uncharacterized protein n=1 Tax=Guyanagaster necrorhizus TaxID=856835 RepID=A0A9P8AMW2_9AGAR|nr:uncharacterized protein BT62DRAFT_553269 [Guyanagaster necrorhizus MCA 3950]KAG7441184.1 hypothetical protein BT62DRAFT_553269 [Guyanagaster necrorhizus MCA 3950]